MRSRNHRRVAVALTIAIAILLTLMVKHNDVGPASPLRLFLLPWVNHHNPVPSSADRSR